MAEAPELTRLEDFIRLAKQGEEVRVKVELKRQTIKQKVHPEETQDTSTEMDAYLLLVDFHFTTGGMVRKISKIYVMGSGEESLDTAKLNKSVTNDRLKMDYHRLQDAKITVEEKYF